MSERLPPDRPLGKAYTFDLLIGNAWRREAYTKGSPEDYSFPLRKRKKEQERYVFDTVMMELKVGKTVVMVDTEGKYLYGLQNYEESNYNGIHVLRSPLGRYEPLCYEVIKEPEGAVTLSNGIQFALNGVKEDEGQSLLPFTVETERIIAAWEIEEKVEIGLIHDEPVPGIAVEQIWPLKFPSSEEERSRFSLRNPL